MNTFTGKYPSQRFKRLQFTVISLKSQFVILFSFPFSPKIDFFPSFWYNKPKFRKGIIGMKDIEFKTENQKFKYRVNGLIIRDGKLLTLLMKNKTSYCLPGGHVELGEDSRSAVIREMQEEINTAVVIDKELAIVENFYTDKNHFDTHEISYYYTVIPNDWSQIPSVDYTKTENDKGEWKEHHFVWLPLKEIDTYDLRPSYLKEKLLRNHYDFEHLIIKE